MCVCTCAYVCTLSHVWLFATPRTLARLLCPWNFPGKNTGVCYRFLLPGTFLTQRSNPHLLCLLHLVGGFFTNCTTWKIPTTTWLLSPFHKWGNGGPEMSGTLPKNHIATRWSSNPSSLTNRHLMLTLHHFPGGEIKTLPSNSWVLLCRRTQLSLGVLICEMRFVIPTL